MDKTTELRNILITEISDENRDREDYGTKEEWESFKNDIDEHGLYSAIAVTPLENGYKLLAGGRRLRACTELNHSHINATVYTGIIDLLDMQIIELNENLKRKSLSLEEEAKSKLKLLNAMQNKYGEKRNNRDKKGVSMNDVATMIGESGANFSRDVQLAKAIDALPILKKAKTKTEAFNILKKGLKGYKEEKRVESFKKEQAKNKSIDTPQSYIAKRYHLGDVFEGIKDASSGMCSLVEIDPPYAVRLKDQKKKKGAVSSADEYNEIDIDDYPTFMTRLLAEAYRVCKDDGWLVLWFGPEPWFEQMYQWAIDAGFIGNRLPGIWNKLTPGQTMQPNLYMANSYEMFFYFRKSNQSELNKPGRSNIFNFKPVPPASKSHPTERPIELMEEVISTFVGKGVIICSPLAGSGNTLLAASNLECNAYGWDLTKSYQNSYVVKALESKPGEYRSY